MTNDPSLTHFGLIRHAITDWNLVKRIQGRQDSPIAPAGHKQAEKWGRLLKPHQWDHILCSDIERALKTAELVNRALHIPIRPEPLLREQDWGEWTGKTLRQIQRETPRKLAEQEVLGWKFCPPGGEALERVWQRSRRALRDAALRWRGLRILVISHEGVLRSLIYRFNNSQTLQNKPLRICPWRLHLLTHDQKELHVEKINALELE